jgi:hypothetical protein
MSHGGDEITIMKAVCVVSISRCQSHNDSPAVSASAQHQACCPMLSMLVAVDFPKHADVGPNPSLTPSKSFPTPPPYLTAAWPGPVLARHHSRHTAAADAAQQRSRSGLAPLQDTQHTATGSPPLSDYGFVTCAVWQTTGCMHACIRASCLCAYCVCFQLQPATCVVQAWRALL